jgi:hypothetical protein
MPEPDSLVLLSRHTGERLALRRVVRDGETCLEIRGTLPPRQQGPPLHVHDFELEEGRVIAGYARPVVDLDRYVHGVFDVMNSGGAHRPSLFYTAHVLWRHRQTQAIVLMPKPIQAIVLPLVVLVGTLLGRYHGTNWPGSPARCAEAPFAATEHV